MLINPKNVTEVNSAYMMDALNEAFEPWQTGEPDRRIPLVCKPQRVSERTILIKTQEAGLLFYVTFDEYSARLVVADNDTDQPEDCEPILAGMVGQNQDDFEEAFADGCISAIAQWW